VKPFAMPEQRRAGGPRLHQPPCERPSRRPIRRRQNQRLATLTQRTAAVAVLSLPKSMVLNTPLTSVCTAAETSPAAIPVRKNPSRDVGCAVRRWLQHRRKCVLDRQLGSQAQQNIRGRVASAGDASAHAREIASFLTVPTGRPIRRAAPRKCSPRGRTARSARDSIRGGG